MRHLARKLILAAVMLAALMAPAMAEPVKVFAAASLKNALDEIGAQWLAESQKEATMVYAASSALAKQIAEGAPADIFISADLAWMDDLAGKNLIKPETRSNLLGNTLVLIAPKDSSVQVDLTQPVDLAALLGDGRLAVADVKAVPAGKYAKAALEKLGLWAVAEPRLAQAENVRAALVLVARGEAPLGIVYGSDAKAEPAVKVAAMFPESSHPAIIYPVALTAASGNQDAAALLDYLRSPVAAAIFEKHGFSRID